MLSWQFHNNISSSVISTPFGISPAKICSRNWNGSGTVLEHQEQF